MTRVIVTGACGFIGSHLVPLLRTEGFHVEAIDVESGDITISDTWSNLPAADAVVHLAGNAFVPASWKDPAAFVHCNVVGTVQALEFCKKHKANLVFLSSYLYGNPESLPIRETAPIITPNPYALSKKLAEDVCRFYSSSFGLSIAILRPFNVFGPGQSDRFIIPSIIRQVLGGREVKVEDLEPRRDYIYVRDLVLAIRKALSSNAPLSICNIGSGESYSVAEIIQMIQDALGSHLPVHSGNSRRKDEIMNTIADVSAAAKLFGWAPKWSFAQGIRETITSIQKEV